MAAKKKASAPAQGVRVEFRKIASRELITVGPNSPFWDKAAVVGVKKLAYSGAIVRVQPPSDATDARIEAVVADLKKFGAAKVTILPRPREKVVREKRKPHEATTLVARKVIESLVDESSFAGKEDLRKVVESVMSEVGL